MSMCRILNTATSIVSVKFKMDNYGGVRIPKSGGDKSLPLNNVD